MRSIVIALIVFLFSRIYFPQINPGAKQVSLSNSDAATSGDVFALFNNPAGLSQIAQREIGVYYSPAPFGLTEMANGFIAYNESFSFGSIAAGGMSYGFDLYRENKFTLGYSYNYQNKFLGGAAINFHTVSIKNYGYTSAFYLDIGGIAYLNNFLRWGFYLHNVNRASFTDEQNQIPVVFNTGFSFDVMNNLTFHLAIEKDLIQNASVQFGVEYNIIKYFSIRTGFSNEPSKFSAGVGVNYSFVQFDYAVFTHQDLGMTHQLGVILSFDKDNQNNISD
ncbi:MAG: PorV/PorQ family protein [Ignavibacteriaceae bacterium]